MSSGHDSSNDEKSVEEQRDCSEYLSVQLLHGVNRGVDVNDSIGEGDDDDGRILKELSADEYDTIFGDLNTVNATQAATILPPRASDIMSTEALKYVAGYVAFKFRFKYPELGVVSSQLNLQVDQPLTICSPWIQCLSRGGLRQPSVIWFQTIQELEREFGKRHGLGLDKQPGIIKRLTVDVLNLVSAPEPAVACFIKTRTFIRMRHINRQAISTKKFVAKKMKKVIQ